MKLSRRIFEAESIAFLEQWQGQRMDFTCTAPSPCKNQEYEQAMEGACAKAIAQGITAMAFGDLFLEDVRKYREDRLKGTGFKTAVSCLGNRDEKIVRTNAGWRVESTDCLR
jgi:hypothetical protein